jgi:hypothetical protein
MGKILAHAGWAAVGALACGSVALAQQIPELRPRNTYDVRAYAGPLIPWQERQPAPDQRITGEVVDRDGKPVVNAEVMFVGPKQQSVRTGRRGEFTFTGPPGDYEITVTAGERRKTFTGMKIENKELKPTSTLEIERESPLDS